MRAILARTVSPAALVMVLAVSALGSGCAPSHAPSPERTTRSATLPAPVETLSTRPGFPTGLTIKSLGVQGRVLALRLRGNDLAPPPDPADFGWWAGGVRPGAEHGSALLTGHAVHDGQAPFNDLDQIALGASVIVTVGNRHLAYRVSKVQVLAKDQLSRQAERLFRQDGPPRLVLVSCERYDGTEFLANTVVFARPVRPVGPTS